ncbi:hypothetical protein ACFS32_17885 [Novosphingobium pokkalii]
MEDPSPPPFIVCAVLPHGETGAVVRLLGAQTGLVAGYVAGARGAPCARC